MSYTAIGRKRVYASIEDLPENQKLVNGDRLLLQTEDGTALIDYENVKIDLQHTTFGDQFRNLVELSSTVESFASTLNTDIEDIKKDIKDLKANDDDTNKIIFGNPNDNTEPITTQISKINKSISDLQAIVDGIEQNEIDIEEIKNIIETSIYTIKIELDAKIASLQSLTSSNLASITNIENRLQKLEEYHK